jgi:hypothetical protein
VTEPTTSFTRECSERRLATMASSEPYSNSAPSEEAQTMALDSIEPRTSSRAGVLFQS